MLERVGFMSYALHQYQEEWDGLGMWHAWERRIMVRNLEGKRLPGRHICRWEGNIRIYVKVIGCRA